MKRSWAATILAFFMAMIGIVLAIGGAWLLILGGSPYYLIAGLALLASAWFLFSGRLLGGWIYVGLFILSAIWGFAESRGNAWAMIPWLVAPLVILIARAAGHADADAARRTAGSSRAAESRLACCSSRRASRSSATNGDTAVAALPAQSSPGMADPSGQSPPAPTGRPMAAPTRRGASRR